MCKNYRRSGHVFKSVQEIINKCENQLFLRPKTTNGGLAPTFAGLAPTFAVLAPTFAGISQALPQRSHALPLLRSQVGPAGQSEFPVKSWIVPGHFLDSSRIVQIQK